MFDLNKAVELIDEKLDFWFREIVKILPNLLLAAFILVLGFLIAKWIRKLAEKIINRISTNHAIANLFSTFIYITAIGIVIFSALSVLKLDKAVTSILAGAGIFGLALAFAFQDIAANFISGIFISFRKPLHIGDIVSVKNYMGKVIEINLRDTVIKTFQGKMVTIPNKDVFQNPVENFSLLGKRRLDLKIGVSYDDDLEKVAQVTLDALKNIKGLAPEEETTLFYQEFNESSISFTVRLWCKSTEQIDYLKMGHDAIISIKKAFDEHKINLPFPVRTLDVKWPEEM